MKKIALALAMVSLSFGLLSQTEKTTYTSVTKKEGHSVSTPSDNYFGYKDQIIKRLVVKEIPQGFPIAQSNQTREEYKRTMLNWFKQNLEMVEPEYQSQLK